MPAADHLRAAAAELLKGVDVLRREIDDLRAEERTLRSLLEGRVTTMAQQMQSHDHAIRRLDDDAQASRLRDAMRDLDVQIAQTKKEQQDEQSRIADAIREREGMIDRLRSHASTLMP